MVKSINIVCNMELQIKCNDINGIKPICYKNDVFRFLVRKYKSETLATNLIFVSLFLFLTKEKAKEYLL